MKHIYLKEKASLKVARGEFELSENDVEEVPKGISPGEWVLVLDKLIKKNYLAHLNPYSESCHKIKIVKQVDWPWKSDLSEAAIAILTLNELIEKAVNKRKIFTRYQSGCRLVYGSSDQLCGLIIDVYKKYIFIQINVAGIDRFRGEIKVAVSKFFPNHVVQFFDNLQYRKQEVLPIHEPEPLEDKIEVVENNIEFSISKKSMQKIGYYYDHRENRAKLLRTLAEIDHQWERGLDLFSYVGSWGLHLLKAGVKHVDFVDQGDMQEDVELNLLKNSFQEQGEFHRADVFKFLDDAYQKKILYDVIVSDPPAFTKSEKNKNNAIMGYEKLHQKSLRLVRDGGLFIAASCTHYVEHHELDKTVQLSAQRNAQTLQLLDVGIQGHDHPAKGFTDKGFYIKYLLYLVHNG